MDKIKVTHCNDLVLTKILKTYTREKAASLTNGVGKTKYLCVNEVNVLLIPYPIHKSISNESQVSSRPETLTCLRNVFRTQAQVRHF